MHHSSPLSYSLDLGKFLAGAWPQACCHIDHHKQNHKAEDHKKIHLKNHEDWQKSFCLPTVPQVKLSPFLPLQLPLSQPLHLPLLCSTPFVSKPFLPYFQIILSHCQSSLVLKLSPFQPLWQKAPLFPLSRWPTAQLSGRVCSKPPFQAALPFCNRSQLRQQLFLFGKFSRRLHNLQQLCICSILSNPSQYACNHLMIS